MEFSRKKLSWQAEELDQDQDQNWIIDPKNVEVLDQKDHLGSVDPEI